MPIAQRKIEEAPLPGENQVSARVVGIGDNRPPLDEEARAQFRENLLAERPDFEVKLDQIVASADRAVVTNDDEYGRAGDLIKIMRAAASHATDAHQRAKQPYLDAGRTVDAAKNALIVRLDGAKAKVQPLMNYYAAKKEAEERAERERVAAEQRRLAEAAAAAQREREQAEREAREAVAAATNAAERAAAEERAAAARAAAEEAMAEAALAPAAPAKAEPVRSDGGSTVSTSTVWNSQIEDYTKAMRAVKSDPKVREAMDAAIKRLVRAGQREIAGVKIWPTTAAVAR